MQSIFKSNALDRENAKASFLFAMTVTGEHMFAWRPSAFFPAFSMRREIQPVAFIKLKRFLGLSSTNERNLTNTHSHKLTIVLEVRVCLKKYFQIALPDAFNKPWRDYSLNILFKVVLARLLWLSLLITDEFPVGSVSMYSSYIEMDPEFCQFIPWQVCLIQDCQPRLDLEANKQNENGKVEFLFDSLFPVTLIVCNYL